MALQIKAVKVPLKTVDGVVRVQGTRVPLDTVITAFYLGSTPEEIAQDYPTLQLPDIYAVLAYYLQNQDEVDHYLREREAQAQRIQAEIEARWSPIGVRQRLLARRQRQAEPPVDPPGS